MRSSDYRNELASNCLKSLVHNLFHKSRKALICAAVLLVLAANESGRAATIVVPAGGNFQAALNAAQCGDTIVLAAGATYTVGGLEQPFLLRYKGPCTNTNADFITIQGSQISSLPAAGQRVSILDAGLMPKLVTNVATPAVEVEPLAHHYRLIGLEIKNDGSTINQALVNVGVSSGTTPHATLQTVPRDIEFDRCYIHSIEDGTDSIYGTGVRGFNIQGSNITIKNSRIAGFRGYYPGTQTPISSNAVLLGAGPGPYTVTNTYLEAWFVPLFTGGGPQWITNRATVSAGATTTQATLSNVANISEGTLIAFKVTGNPNFAYEVARVTGISGNTVTYIGQASVDGTGNPLVRNPNSPGDAVWEGDIVKDVTITRNDFVLNPVVVETIANMTGNFGKGCIELKLGKNVLIEGNVFSGPSLAFTLTTRNQTDGLTAGANPWATLENITIRNNWKRETSTFHNGHIFGIQMEDNVATSKRGRGLLIENNLFEGSTSPLAQIGGSDDVVFRHNTAVDRQGNPDVSMVFGYSSNNPGFILQDNIIYNGEYGLNCQLGGLSACWPSLVMQKNLIVDNRSPAQQNAQGPLANVYSAGNLYTASLSQIGFVNPSAGNWALSPSSPYKGVGTNGTDPGVNMVALLAALGGNPLPLPSPTPTPSVTPTPSPTATPLPTPTPSPSPSPTPSPSPSPTPPPGVGTTASFIRVDTTTQGNWRGVYGIDGHNVINDSAAYPSYVQVTPNSQTAHLWVGTSSDTRALQRLGSSNRIAACWYSTSQFSVDVNFTDGQAHQLALYGLDWDDNGRAQRIDILDATNSALLDSRTLSSFRTGRYVVWNIRGHVRINITRTSGMNGVISGLFFGPITPSGPISPASVDRARVHAGNLVNTLPLPNNPGTPDSENANVDPLLTADLEALTTDIGLAYQDFNNERNMFGAVTSRIELQLWGALYFSRAQAALAAKTGATNAVRNHLLRIVSHLAMAEDLMLTGAVSPATAAEAAAVNAQIDVLIGPALAGYGATNPARLAPLSLGSVFGDPVVSPLSSQTLFGAVGSDGTVPYELAGVSVTVGGKAVPVLYVSPSRVSFYVAPDVAEGTAEVIVTSQNGFVSRGTTTIVRNVTRLMTATENENGTAIALNASRQTMASFAAITPENFGSDKRTRVEIYATGISGSAINSNPSNDIVMGGLVRPNFAEAVRVEARKSNGTVINLPVEFAGTQGLLPGLDQVNVVITSQLAGAGTVQLTLIIGGQRSNGPTIVVQ